MAIGNVKPKQEIFLKRLRMGTAKIKSDKDTEEGKQKRANMGRWKAGTKERRPEGLIKARAYRHPPGTATPQKQWMKWMNLYL